MHWLQHAPHDCLVAVGRYLPSRDRFAVAQTCVAARNAVPPLVLPLRSNGVVRLPVHEGAWITRAVVIRVPRDLVETLSNVERVCCLVRASALGVIVDWRPSWKPPSGIGGPFASIAVSRTWREDADTGPRVQLLGADKIDAVLLRDRPLTETFLPSVPINAGLCELIVHELAPGSAVGFGRLVKTSLPNLRRLGAPLNGLSEALCPASSSRIEAVDAFMRHSQHHPFEVVRLWALVFALPRLNTLNIAGIPEPRNYFRKGYPGPALGTPPAPGLRRLSVDCGAELTGLNRKGLRAVLACAPNLTELEARIVFTLARQAPEIVCAGDLVLPKLRAVRLVLHESCADITCSSRVASGCLGKAAMDALAGLAPDLRRLRIETRPRAGRLARPRETASDTAPNMPFRGQVVRLFGSHANPRLPRFLELRVIELPGPMLEHRETRRWWAARRRCLPRCEQLARIAETEQDEGGAAIGWSDPCWANCFAGNGFLCMRDG